MSGHVLSLCFGCVDFDSVSWYFAIKFLNCFDGVVFFVFHFVVTVNKVKKQQ